MRPRLPAVGLRAVPAWLPGLGLLLLLTVPAWAPLLHPEFSLWQVFDGSIHLRRTLFLWEGIAGGDWYPRWFPEQYGATATPHSTSTPPACTT